MDADVGVDGRRGTGIGRQFASFTLVGTVGFVVDAGLFVLLTNRYLWAIWAARTLSLGCAIAATWTLNRWLTFAQHKSAHAVRELVRYALAQLFGALVNLGVFALALWAFAPLRAMPIVALILGSAAALACNFTVARLFVFRGAAPATPAAS